MTSKLLLGAFVLFASGLALAGQSREVRLREEATLQGKTIPAGVYTLRWKNAGDSTGVELIVVSGTKVVARASGTRVPLEKAADHDTVVFQVRSEGPREISRILTSGKKEAIRIDAATTSGAE